MHRRQSHRRATALERVGKYLDAAECWSQLRDAIQDPHDIADAFVRAVDDDRTHRMRYPLCGPKVYTLRELVAYVGELTGHNRPVVPLGPALSKLQARVLELLPGKLMSRDNLASMALDSVCDCEFPAVFGSSPTALEAVAPDYLAPAATRSRYSGLRAQGGR